MKKLLATTLLLTVFGMSANVMADTTTAKTEGTLAVQQVEKKAAPEAQKHPSKKVVKKAESKAEKKAGEVKK